MKKILSLLTILLIVFSASTVAAHESFSPAGASNPPSHEPWTKLLKKYVNNEGLVNNKGLIRDIKELDAYLSTLTNNPPGDTWNKMKR